MLELLVVILIIGVLAAALLSTYQQARNAAWKQKTRDSARQIATAWNTYSIENRGFPAATAFVPDPTYNTDANSITFETTTTNMAVLNASQTYLEQSTAQRRNGMTDKWGRYFHIRMDTNYNGLVSSPLDATPIRANIVVWSIGPEPSTPVKSWVMVWPQ
jgi:type II secretory pathway pseudopilin PulG